MHEITGSCELHSRAMSPPAGDPRHATDRERTILFAPASNVLFHVGRSLELARHLSRRGHRIVFMGTPRYLRDPDVGAREEFEFHEAPDFDAEKAMEMLRTIRKRPSRSWLEELIAAEHRVLGEVAPDLVVADFRPTMFLAARERGIPIVSLLLSHWMEPVSAVPPWTIRTHPVTATLLPILGEAVTRFISTRVWRWAVRYKSRPFRAAELDRGQTPHRTIFETMDGDLNLLTDSEAWSPTHPLPDHYRRVGPIVWEPVLPLPAAAADLDPQRPIVYVTFGSTGHVELFRTIVDGFANSRYQVFVSTGAQIDPAEISGPENVIVERFLPNGKIMGLADLVIYHGGSGTAYHVVSHGVPSIVVATHWDQEFAGVVTEEHGLGLHLTLRQVVASPSRLLDAADRVLENLASYRDRVERFRKELFRYDGPASAAKHVDAFLCGRSN